MDITIAVNRTKTENEIIEIFTWQPVHRFANDPSRQFYHLIRNKIVELSMHKEGFILTDIEDWTNKIIYKYKLSNERPSQLMDCAVVKYFPALGKKSCQKCTYYKIYRGKEYCITKGIKLNKNSSYRCLYWVERIEGRNVHHGKRPKRNDKVNERIQNRDSRRGNTNPNRRSYYVSIL